MIVDKLKASGDFVALAAQYSTDTATKNNGGDVGWFGKGEMATEFETAAYSMTVGTVSAPVHSQFGYHVIQVLAHGQHPVSASALATQRSAALQTWLDAQRSKAMANSQPLVQIFDNWSTDVPTAPALPTP
jgi:parvulin-like peptidyl-prolyl isomerase